MITYRSHVYSLAMAATTEATGLALSLANCVAQQCAPDYVEYVRDMLSDLQLQATALRDTVGEFLSALPDEIGRDVGYEAGLLRHVFWIGYWLDPGPTRELRPRPNRHCWH